MDTARELDTGRTWTAERYARTPDDRRPGGLECEGTSPDGPCGAPAYFRRASSDGRRRPCFFSTRHRPDCDVASVPSEDGAPGPPQPVTALAAALTRIRVDLTPSAPSAGPDGRGRPVDGQPGAGVRHHDRDHGDVPTTGTSTRRLRGLLASFVDGSLPRRADVEVDGLPVLPVETFFVCLASVDIAAAQHRRAYVGRIEKVRPSHDGSCQLLVEDSVVSVVLTAEAAGAHRRALDGDDLPGGWVLVLGTPKPNRKDPGRGIVKATSAASVALLGASSAPVRRAGQGCRQDG